VEPKTETEWNRPAATTSALTAHDFLRDAINDYSGRYDRYITMADSILKEDDPDLYKALKQWSDCPILPLPEPAKVCLPSVA
jgi:hypothetical protein